MGDSGRRSSSDPMMPCARVAARVRYRARPPGGPAAPGGPWAARRVPGDSLGEGRQVALALRGGGHRSTVSRRLRGPMAVPTAAWLLRVGSRWRFPPGTPAYFLEKAKCLPRDKADGNQHEHNRRRLLMGAHPRRCLTCCLRTHQGHLGSPPFPAPRISEPAEPSAVCRQSQPLLPAGDQEPRILPDASYRVQSSDSEPKGTRRWGGRPFAFRGKCHGPRSTVAADRRRARTWCGGRRAGRFSAPGGPRAGRRWSRPPWALWWYRSKIGERVCAGCRTWHTGSARGTLRASASEEAAR